MSLLFLSSIINDKVPNISTTIHWNFFVHLSFEFHCILGWDPVITKLLIEILIKVVLHVTPSKIWILSCECNFQSLDLCLQCGKRIRSIVH